MSNKTEIKLSEYQEPDFLVEDVFLDFDLDFEKTQVLSVIKFKRNGDHNKSLILHGEKLKLVKVNINETNLGDDQVKLTDTQMIISDVPDEFTLTTLVELAPAQNFSGEGLYQSGNILCTQNEAEGFRKITYYLDRPDVMAPFTTSLTANKKKFPQILANGNKISEKDEGEKHTVVWKDPHPKPCYLFALVGGELGVVKDEFTTKSGKKVDLEIYVDPGNEDKCDHAMRSLKNSMKWDEDTFGLEYDLSVYMVVAVDSFNMGAMENKGLNIFNSAYVLAKQDTATDSDFQGIEAVIGHEYFHNWTGNRVTCRDWFQLTLKEGLTVFRDQEFSSDMLSRPVKRIEDVQRLRRHQFKEDAGPLSHPIQPKSYIEINNFYTATVYEKGAEVIRMIHTLLGKENFRKGVDLYFERHDGSAVTTMDFISSMEDASGIDLKQFRKWYDQNGTPRLDVQTNFENGELHISFIQSSFINGEETELHFPLEIALFSQNGKLLKEERLDIKEKITKLVIKCESQPILSLNRNYTAPVIINYDYSEDELIKLLKYETDEFNKYDALQLLYRNEIKKLINSYESHDSHTISDSLIDALGSILGDSSLDHAFKALLFALPTESEVNEIFDIYKIDSVHKAINELQLFIAKNLQNEFAKVYESINQNEFDLSSRAMGERQLKNTALSYLARLENNFKLIESHFDSANNMTDEFSALKNAHLNLKEESKPLLKKFYKKWKHETLVMQKWLALQASHPEVTLAELESLETSDVFNIKVPNLIRSVVGAFASNMFQLNQEDGSGYKYLATKISEIDAFNPQMAARLAKCLNHKKRLDGQRKSELVKVLEDLSKMSLSADTFEVIEKNMS